MHCYTLCKCEMLCKDCCRFFLPQASKEEHLGGGDLSSGVCCSRPHSSPLSVFSKSVLLASFWEKHNPHTEGKVNIVARAVQIVVIANGQGPKVLTTSLCTFSNVSGPWLSFYIPVPFIFTS